MKIMQWVAFIFILSICILHIVLPNIFVLDKFSVCLMLLLAIPLLAPHLKKAKWFGTEFVFKDEIKKLDSIVGESERQAQDAETRGSSRIKVFETFSTRNALAVLELDPILSLAALRIEIEQVLAKAADGFGVASNAKKGARFYGAALYEQGLLSREQSEALNVVINMCNEAIHGVSLSRNEAKEVIRLAERLNKSFCMGYSIKFEPNKNYSKQGLVCEWEHCIEWMPLTKERTGLSCPVFGHNCPGGVEKVSLCDKDMNDIPSERFAKK